MSKVKIVIVSVLKPLKDPRHFERFALSLAKTNKYEINIIANGEKKQIDIPNIKLHSTGKFPRSVIQRCRLQLRAFQQIRKLKPKLLIVCSLELLPYIALYRLMHSCKIIFDIQENHALNLKHQQAHGKVYRSVALLLVKLFNWLSTLVVDHYFMAEKCYANQLDFIGNQFTILENKTVIRGQQIQEKFNPENKQIRMLFSGTISYYSGIDKVLHLVDVLRKKKIDFELTIIGQIHDQKIADQLTELKDKNIKMQVSREPVAHSSIINEIQKANLGLITYQPNVINEYKVPTKLYEYTSYKLPYLIQENTYWAALGGEMGGAIPFNFNEPVVSLFRKKLPSVYPENDIELPKEASWVSEEDLFLRSIIHLLK